MSYLNEALKELAIATRFGILRAYRAFLLDKAKANIIARPNDTKVITAPSGAVTHHTHEAHARHSSSALLVTAWRDIAWWDKLTDEERMTVIGNDTHFLSLLNPNDNEVNHE